MKWPQSAGVIYDATLHTFIIGFVFAMIFGHAPVIFPAVFGLPVQFRWTAFVPLAVLDVSLMLTQHCPMAAGAVQTGRR